MIWTPSENQTEYVTVTADTLDGYNTLSLIHISSALASAAIDASVCVHNCNAVLNGNCTNRASALAKWCSYMPLSPEYQTAHTLRSVVSLQGSDR